MEVDPPRRLILRAEMKLPGVATLTCETEPADEGGTRIVLSARYRPRGLLGIVYWYSVLPLHGVVFKGMVSGLAREAERIERGGRDATQTSPATRSSAPTG